MSRGPVIISPYDPEWVMKYQREEKILKDNLNRYILQIEHIGSTSVPGLAAKPILDIMIALKSLKSTPDIINIMESLGYEYVSKFESEMPFRRYFVKKGDTEHLIHVHMVEQSHEFWIKQLIIREYLREFDEAKDDYMKLKIKLAKEYGEDRKGYQNGKSDFLNDLENKALEYYHISIMK